VDALADLWSFGVLAYELLAGVSPFQTDSSAATVARILQEEPPSLATVPGVPFWLAQLVSQLLRKNPAERPQTAREVLQNLDAGPRAPMQRPAAHKSSRTIDSVAVLPFLNVGGDQDIDYLCEGITESLINNLSQVPKLRVVPRSTAFRYKSAEIDRAARDLRVRALLSGRILQKSDALVVQVELVDTAADSQLWGEKYNRKLTDIFSLEEEIVREITDALRIKLKSAEKKASDGVSLKTTRRTNSISRDGISGISAVGMRCNERSNSSSRRSVGTLVMRSPTQAWRTVSPYWAPLPSGGRGKRSRARERWPSGP